MAESKLELEFEMAWRIAANDSQYSDPTQEYRFATDRQWRFDFAWPSQHVAVECEGGIYKPKSSQGTGRHLTSTGFQGDVEKYNRAASLGWLVLRFTSKDLQQDPLGCCQLVMKTLQMRMVQ